jgi:hypothetical protein
MITLNNQLLLQAIFSSGLLLVIFSIQITSIFYIYGQIENATISNQTAIQPPNASCPKGSILLLNGTCATQSTAASCPKGSILLLNGTCATQSTAASCPKGSMLLVNGSCPLLNAHVDTVK